MENKVLKEKVLDLEINLRLIFMGIFYVQFKDIKLYKFIIKKALKPK